MNYIENPSPYNQTVSYKEVPTKAAHANKLTCKTRNAAQGPRDVHMALSNSEVNKYTDMSLKLNKEMRRGPTFSSSLI